MEVHFQLFKGKHIKYTTYGKGDPMFLIHGYQADSRIWNRLIPKLKDKYQLIVPDLPGHGQSPLIQSTNTMEFLSDIIYNISISLGYKGISIAGHSMGGYVALAFAEKYLNMTDRLILINSHPFEDGITRTLARNREAEIIQQGKKEMLLRSFVQNNFSSSSTIELKEEIDFATEMAMKQPDDGMLADLTGMMTRTCKKKLLDKQRLNIEFILGMADTRVPIKKFNQTPKHEDKIHWLVDCGHMSILEKPDEVAIIIAGGTD